MEKLARVKYFIFSIYLLFSSEIFGASMQWIPAVCTIGGYEIVFLGADVYYAKDDAVTLFGPIRQGGDKKNWIERTDRVREPIVADELPYAYDVLWYATAENKAYKFSMHESRDYPISLFNRQFLDSNEFKIVFCIGAKGRVFTYLSNGFERKLISVNIGGVIPLDDFENKIDFERRHEDYIKQLDMNPESVIEKNIQYISYISQVPKIRIRVNGDKTGFLILNDISKQVRVYDLSSIDEKTFDSFPTVIRIYDSAKEFLARVELISEFEQYGNTGNLTLTVTTDAKNREVRVTLHRGNELIYSK